MSHELSDSTDAAPIDMPKSSFPWLWLVLAAVAGVLAFRSLLPKHTAEGKRLPSLSVQPLTFAGERVTLDGVKGKVVLLNFWGPWCPPCRMELPHIAELARRYADDARCRVLAVSCGSGEPDPASSLPDLKQQTEELLSKMELELPVYADPDGNTRRALNQVIDFGGYPTTLVLDPQGVIRQVWVGYADGLEDEMVQTVESLLAEAGA